MIVAKRALRGTGSAAFLLVLGLVFVSITILMTTVYLYYLMMHTVVSILNGA